MMRHIGKQILTLAMLAGLALPALAQGIVTTVVTDPLTGVALDGYDPVSYFTESEPRLGSPDYEFVWAGVPWYFASAANRDVFMRAPDVYAPQHGGYCEMSLARGYLSDGKPKIYRVLPADGKPLTADEAMLMIDDEAYLVFRTAGTDRLSVLLRRPDGNFDLVEC